MTSFKTTTILALVLACAGCSNVESEPVAAADIVPPFESFSVNTPEDALGATNDQAMQRTADLMSAMSPGETMNPLFMPNATLEESERGAGAALHSSETMDEAGKTVLRQTVASIMVQRHLNAALPDLRAIERYTQILLDEKSPNAHLLARALPALRADWGDARVHTAASQAGTEAAAWLDRTCPACQASAIGRSGTPKAREDAQEVGASQRSIREGIEALGAI